MQMKKVCVECREELRDHSSRCPDCDSADYENVAADDLEDMRTGGLDDDS